MSVECPKCNRGNGWIIKEEVCIWQDDVSVECECNTIGCGVRKNIFLNINEGVEDFNDQ